MAWTNSLKLTLESSSVVSGLLDITRTAGKAAGAVGDIAGVATRAGGAMLSAFKGVGDVLFKLPDQVRALSGMLSALSLPSKLAGSAETTQVAFGVLLGSAEKAREVLARIQTLAAETPFEFPELADSARKLAAFGESADSIPDTLRRIGDIAAGTQSSITDLAFIYGKARVAGTLYAEDINQLLERGIPVMAEFAQQLGVQESAVKKLASEGQITFPMLEEAFRSLTAQGGKFADMMAMISGTFEGKLSNLSGGIHELLAKLGAGINEGLKPVMDELTAQLEKQGGLAKSIGDNIGFGIEVAMEVLKSGEAGKVMAEGLEYAAAAFSNQMLKLMDALGVKLAGLAEVAAMKASDMATPDILKTEGRKKQFQENLATTEEYNEMQVNNVMKGEGPLAGLVKEQKGQFDAATAGARDRTHQNRARRANEKGIDEWNKKEEAAAREKAAAEKADEDKQAKDGEAAAAALDKDVHEIQVTLAGGEDELLLQQPEPDWYDDEGKKKRAEAQGRVDAKKKKEEGAVKADSPPRGGSGGGGRPGRSQPGYDGPSKAEAMRDRMAAATAGGDGDAGESRHRIHGARYAAGAASGLGTGNAYRNMSAGKADRMAGMANSHESAAKGAHQSAETASKAAMAVVKLLPEIEKNARRIAQNTDH